jgi:hypothetical protein
MARGFGGTFRGSDLLSRLGFSDPAAAQLLCGNTCKVRLNVQDRRAVEHVHPVHVEHTAVAPSQFNNRERNGVGPTGRSRGKDAMRAFLKRRAAD